MMGSLLHPDCRLPRSQSGAGAIADVANFTSTDEIARAAAEHEELGYGVD